MERRLIAKSCGLVGAIGTLKASLDILAVLSFTPIKIAELLLFPFELPTQSKVPRTLSLASKAVKLAVKAPW